MLLIKGAGQQFHLINNYHCIRIDHRFLFRVKMLSDSTSPYLSVVSSQYYNRAEGSQQIGMIKTLCIFTRQTLQRELRRKLSPTVVWALQSAV